MFARSWPEMATTEPGMWSIALAVRVALTTTSGEYLASGVSAETSGSSPGAGVAAYAGAAAMKPATSVPAAVSMKRTVKGLTICYLPRVVDRMLKITV